MTSARCSWIQEESPWCGIVIISLFILGWPHSKTSLAGNKFAAACARRPDGGAGGVRSPLGGWSSSSHLLIFPRIVQFGSKHSGVSKTLTESGDQRMIPRKLRKHMKGPPAVWLNAKMISPSFLSWNNSIFPLPWCGEHHSSAFVVPCIHFYIPLSLPLFSHCIARAKPFLQQKKTPSLETVMYKQERPPFNKQEKH